MTFFTTTISDSVYPMLEEVLHSTYLSEGKYVTDFENRLSKRLKIKNPVALNSGTSALHLGLLSAGIGNGDEVIIPAQTFIATGLAVLYCGAKPVFADIQLETGNIDPESIKKKITNKTKAIIPVHWGGYPCDLDEIHKIAEDNNLFVLEDAAHALGAEYKGKKIGSVSRFTAFSFQAIKILTTGDGGALSCLYEKDYEYVKKLRWFGIDRLNTKTSYLGEREYNLDVVGYKYHMNNIAAAIGLGNLDIFQNILKRRREIAKIYFDELSNVPGLNVLKYKDDRISAYWLFTILVDKRNEFVKKMKDTQIPVSIVHQRIDKNKIFRQENDDLEEQKKFDEMQISIPIHNKLTDEDILHILKSVKA